MSDDDAAPANTAGAPSPPERIVRELLITNKRGLHARASAKFVQMVEHFEAEIWVTRSGETVGGTSIMGLMMLSAGPGTSIVVSAQGPRGAGRARRDCEPWSPVSSTKKALKAASKRIGHDAAVDAERRAVGGARWLRAEIADPVRHLFRLGVALQQRGRPPLGEGARRRDRRRSCPSPWRARQGASAPSRPRSARAMPNSQ